MGKSRHMVPGFRSGILWKQLAAVLVYGAVGTIILYGFVEARYQYVVAGWVIFGGIVLVAYAFPPALQPEELLHYDPSPTRSSSETHTTTEMSSEIVSAQVYSNRPLLTFAQEAPSVALIACPACNHQISDRATACPSCGHPISASPNHPIDVVSPYFEAEIASYVRYGWRLVSRTPTTAQLVRKSGFSAFWSIAWFLLCGFGVLIYIFYHMGKSETVVYLMLNTNGQIETTVNGVPQVRNVANANIADGDSRMMPWTCVGCGGLNSSRRQSCRSCQTARPSIVQ